MGVAIAGVLALACQHAIAANVPACTKAELLSSVPEQSEGYAHRQFERPVLKYPFGTQLPLWGVTVAVRVDETGAVTCYHLGDDFDRDAPLNPQRRELLESLATWRYSPFLKDGKPAPAIVKEWIDEEERPERHIPLPNAAQERIKITLERTQCFGTCPSYRVEIRGDGLVTYTGRRYVDVEGEHIYKVPVVDVARLIVSLSRKDIWSLRSEYAARITDLPGAQLTLQMGNQTHSLKDYVGRYAGMPRAVNDFEQEIDNVAQTHMWLYLASPAVEHLKAEHFDFRSPQGAELLARAIANPNVRDDAAILSLIELGAPVDRPMLKKQAARQGTSDGSLLELALAFQRSTVVDALIAKGALLTDGRTDPAKVDAAFRAAIRGGLLAPVQKIWELTPGNARPSLWYTSLLEEQESTAKRTPVTLSIQPPFRGDRPWEALAIVQWLVAQGAEVKGTRADGNTLLHIATSNNDKELVRYALAQGVPAATPGRYNLPALGSAEDEDIALMLLTAGTPVSSLNQPASQFREFARSRGWSRVIDWLDTHPN